ncbi:MAG: aminodeoxychorismate lyase [Pseudomonadota bacterium]
MSALFNGVAASDLAQSRGLHYGDGVFRTILIWNEQLLDWNQHLEKLSKDCAALELNVPDFSLLKAEATQLAAEQARAVLKVMVMRQSGGRGYRFDAQASDRLLLRYPAPKYAAQCWTSGVNTFCSNFKLSLQPALAGIKHLNRLEQVLASRHWPASADEGILCNQADQLISGTRSNLFWVRAGVLCTPSLEESGVSGMMRKKILALAESMRIPTSIVKAPRTELESADEAFVSNSLIGIWPLRQFEQREWIAPGAITLKLSAALQHPRLV